MSLKLCLFTVVNFLMSVTTCFATTNQVRYTAAVVIFNYTDASTSPEQEPTYLGSQSAADEAGAYAYGSSFPAKRAFGIVVHSLDDATGLKDGCNFIYSRAPQSQPWIALISRGMCKFSDKIDNAYKQNASGVIVYDVQQEKNDSTVMSVIMNVRDAPDIAAVSITRKLGCQVAKLIDEGTQVFVNISPGQVVLEKPNICLPCRQNSTMSIRNKYCTFDFVMRVRVKRLEYDQGRTQILINRKSQKVFRNPLSISKSKRTSLWMRDGLRCTCNLIKNVNTSYLVTGWKEDDSLLLHSITGWNKKYKRFIRKLKKSNCTV